MYTAFYGLREKPFTLSPDPRYLFLAESHREALAHLLYGIDEGEGFIAITGEVGTGKTTICRTLLQRIGASTEIAFIFNPSLSPSDLIDALNSELGLESGGRSLREKNDQLNRFLLEKHREGRRVLLIIDEAQNLPTETLEQVRLLSNLETETAKLLQILLIGQPELEAKLASAELRQLRQRIGVHWRLGPLSVRETADYVRHRLRIAAGAERDIFTPAALRLLHRRSGGIPRLLNVLCDRALLAGYAESAREIRRSLIEHAHREQSREGISTRRRRGWLRWAMVAPLLLAAGAGAGFAIGRGVPAWRALIESVQAPAAPAASAPAVSARGEERPGAPATAGESAPARSGLVMPPPSASKERGALG